MNSILVRCILLVFLMSSSAWGDDICGRTSKSSANISHISRHDGDSLFKHLANPGYRIPYLNAANNCHSRAYRVSHILKSEFNLNTLRIFVEAKEPEWVGAGASSYTNPGDSNESTLFSGTTVRGHHQTWSRHTGTAICIDGTLNVIDHSLFTKPVSYSKWLQSFTRGLSPSDYTIQMKNMYTLFHTQSQPGSFKASDLQTVDSDLRQDWNLHVQLIRK